MSAIGAIYKPFLYYRKVLRTSYNIKRSTENCFAIFAGEQKRGMKSKLKGQKNLIMPLLFFFDCDTQGMKK